ncbi:MAG: hypothetical protein IT290_06025 [Deltaproteobacteria bacterium]|nr:hypothetical protein [Deltaproteobacteria bacterium]
MKENRWVAMAGVFAIAFLASFSSTTVTQHMLRVNREASIERISVSSGTAIKATPLNHSLESSSFVE